MITLNWMQNSSVGSIISTLIIFNAEHNLFCLHAGTSQMIDFADLFCVSCLKRESLHHCLSRFQSASGRTVHSIQLSHAYGKHSLKKHF